MKNARPAALPALTGLRFIAALCVVLAHGASAMTNMPSGMPLWQNYLMSLSAYGMSLFFVLSGFVIHYNYAEQISTEGWRGTVNFFVARFARLYPLYIIAVVLSVYCQGLFYAAWEGDPAAIDNLKSVFPFYVASAQSWIYMVKGDFSLIYQYPSLHVLSISWSISTEWFFYMIYPIICIGSMRLRRAWLPLAAVSVAIIAFLANALLFYNADVIDHFAEARFGSVAGTTHGFQDSFFRWAVYFSPYMRIPEFLLGCIAAAAYRALEHLKPTKREEHAGCILTYAALMLAIGIDIVMFMPSHPLPFLAFLHMNFGFAIPAALLIFGVARYQSRLARLLSGRTMLVCGEASYSIYLLHQLIIPAAGLAILPLGQSGVLDSILVIRLLVAVVALVGFSIVTYSIVEHPARILLRRILTVPPPVPAGETQPAFVSAPESSR